MISMNEPFYFQVNQPVLMKDRILKVSTEGQPGCRPSSSYHISQAMAGMEVNQATLFVQMAAHCLQGLDPSALMLKSPYMELGGLGESVFGTLYDS